MNKKNLLLCIISCLFCTTLRTDNLEPIEDTLQPAGSAPSENSSEQEHSPEEISLADIIEPAPAQETQSTAPLPTATPTSLLGQIPDDAPTPDAPTMQVSAEPNAEEILARIPENKEFTEKPKPFKLAKSPEAAKKLISFNYENEDLTKIIDEFAALEGLNIIIPTGTNAITQKVTLKIKKKITLEQAEGYLNTLLDIAGYSIIPRGDFYQVIKNDPQITREQLPLFVDIPAKDLPNDGRIQVIYYLQNLKVPENTQNPADSLNVILNDMLSVNRSYNFDSKSNAVIISDKASNIKATMEMILELDAMGVQDVIRQIQLFNVYAPNVANILQSQIIAVSGTQQGRLRAEVKSESGLYFSPGTKIVGDARTNSLVIMGKGPAVERIIEFVQNYIDVPLETGKSILHYYELQYLDAEQFAEVLKKIVNSQGASGQATTDSGSSSPSRGFEGVIIVPEKPVEEVIEKLKLADAIPGSQSVLKGTVYRGGNRIIVAARERDWKRIQTLIRDLDKPQYQVIVQVMVVDFTATNNKIFGTQTRNPSFFQLPAGFNFQTTHLIAPPIGFGANATTPPATSLATDLLALISGQTPPASEAALLTNGGSTQPSTPATTGQPGSLILSMADPDGSGIWTFLQWLNSFGETRVLSHPYLIARNNTKADEIISTIKRIEGDASTGEGGLLAAKQQEIEAALKVSVVPRVSSKDRVNMQISITVNNFVGGPTNVSTAGNSVNTRELHTNVNMGSGQMLVLGGLSETDESETDNETPLLGRIPLLRWLFASSTKATTRTNVTVFLIPTIVEPKIRSGMNKYSKDKIDLSYTDIEQGDLFDQMRDPVTYLFFKEQNISADTLDEYLADTQGDYVRRGRDAKKRRPTGEPVLRAKKTNNRDCKAGTVLETKTIPLSPHEKVPSDAPPAASAAERREFRKDVAGAEGPLNPEVHEGQADPQEDAYETEHTQEHMLDFDDQAADEPAEKNIITQDSQELKKMLTPEKNPLLM